MFITVRIEDMVEVVPATNLTSSVCYKINGISYASYNIVNIELAEKLAKEQASCAKIRVKVTDIVSIYPSPRIDKPGLEVFNINNVLYYKYQIANPEFAAKLAEEQNVKPTGVTYGKAFVVDDEDEVELIRGVLPDTYMINGARYEKHQIRNPERAYEIAMVQEKNKLTQDGETNYAKNERERNSSFSHQDMLVTILGEEANEVAMAASKILRFGMHDVYEATNKSNEQRLKEEINDLLAVCDLLWPDGYRDNELIGKKIQKVGHYVGVSKQLGRVHEC